MGRKVEDVVAHKKALFAAIRARGIDVRQDVESGLWHFFPALGYGVIAEPWAGGEPGLTIGLFPWSGERLPLAGYKTEVVEFPWLESVDADAEHYDHFTRGFIMARGGPAIKAAIERREMYRGYLIEVLKDEVRVSKVTDAGNGFGFELLSTTFDAKEKAKNYIDGRVSV